MPRRARVEEIGFYHVINRGVERRDVFIGDDDRDRFLEIVDESASQYHFVLHAYCLLNNHYHFLLETKEKNLSLLMRQINSKYSIYFNKKYQRVGPLWQGRFKSWYVYDDAYLFSLIKYIENNPVQAGLSQKMGDFKYASSYFLNLRKADEAVMRCFDSNLIRSLESELSLLGASKNIISEKDEAQLAALHQAKFKTQDQTVVRLKKRLLNDYELLRCDISVRNDNIVKAVFDGYRQSELAEYLGVSHVLISKVVKHHRSKRSLFEKYKRKGLFWSYSKALTFEQLGDDALSEIILKYGGFGDLKLALDIFGLKNMKRVWRERLVDDKRFIRLNLFIARVIFSMDVESDYFKEKKNARYEKLRLLAG